MSASETPAPSPPENPNAEKIEAARQRQRARREADRILQQERQRRERDPWSTDPTNIFLDLVGEHMAYVFLLGAAGLLVMFVIWLFQGLRWPVFYFLQAADFVTGAAILPGAPYILWTIWGALFGACLGNWLIAPIYGQRENRPLMLLLPLLLMLISGLIFWAFLR